MWQLGAGIFEMLAPQSGERIIDLGCGTGQLTAKIAESGATVLGIDASPAMVASATRDFPEIDFTVADARSFVVDPAFDAVFSNATLHWVKPAEAVVDAVYAALKPGGRFVAEFGGHGNVDSIVRALSSELTSQGHPVRNPWFYPSIPEYAAILERGGFEVRFAQLFDRPTELAGEDGMKQWLDQFAGAFFESLSDSERHAITASTVERLRPSQWREGTWIADYRRIRIVAIRQG